jgi:hypothetical protein
MDVAVTTHDYCLGVAEHSRNLEATGALDIHEKGIRRLYKSLQFVCRGLDLRAGV